MRCTYRITLASLAASALLAGACTRDTTGLEPAPFPADSVVFDDAFARGVSYQAFSGSRVDALSVDGSAGRVGTTSIRVTVPAAGDAAGGFAGGALVASMPRDLTQYDALTFWARASRNATLNTAGYANDNTGTSQYTVEQANLPLTTAWKKYVLPIPLAARLTRERGMFYFAEGPENGAGYELWFDQIQFERLGTIVNPRPVMASATATEEVGGTRRITGTRVTFDVGGVDQTLDVAPGYFTYASSDPGVATVAPDGTISTVGAGQATITATLGGTPVAGAVTLTTVAPPAVAAPAPTRAAADVLSLFSDAYTSVPVGTWSAPWDLAELADVAVAGNAVKKYTNLTYAGVEFTAPTVDASAMTHLHVDLWTYDASAFRIKLVDFGADGAFGGGDDSEHEVALSASSTPAIGTGAWNSIDIPLSAFTGLHARAHLGQMILSGASGTIYIDNLYFYKAEAPPPPPSAPTTAAPTPTYAAGDVIALYSNAYTTHAVDTWSAVWDQADLADTTIAGDDVKKYTNLVFAGIEFTSATIDASAMTAFRMDVWTPDPTAAPAVLKVKLVDFGADGAWGGGDDVEQELTFSASTTPALATGSWVTLDIPLAQFTGLTTRAHLAQLIISGDPKTVFVDNVLLHR